MGKNRRRGKARPRGGACSPAKQGALVGSPDAPLEGSDAGDDSDLRDAYVRGTVSSFRATANRHLATAKKLEGQAPSAAEREARRAIDAVVRAFWWAEGTELEERQHEFMHAIGRWTRKRFGCALEFDGEKYARTCPIDIAHKRMGFSIGFTGKRVCSVCGEDLSECPHRRGRSYWVRGGPRGSAPCPVCLQEACRHRRNRLYRVSVVSMVTAIKGREVSVVAQPANPEARFVSIPVSTDRLVHAFGPGFKAGRRVSCDKCLGACWGFDELSERAEPGGRAGAVVGAAMTDAGELGLTIALPGDWESTS